MRDADGARRVTRAARRAGTVSITGGQAAMHESDAPGLRPSIMLGEPLWPAAGDSNAPKMVREMAWTSPIRYMPPDTAAAPEREWRAPPGRRE